MMKIKLNTTDNKGYDHLDDVTLHLNGIRNEIKKLNKLIANPKNSKEIVEAATDLRNTLSKQRDEIRAVLDRAKKSAAKK